MKKRQITGDFKNSVTVHVTCSLCGHFWNHPPTPHTHFFWNLCKNGSHLPPLTVALNCPVFWESIFPSSSLHSPSRSLAAAATSSLTKTRNRCSKVVVAVVVFLRLSISFRIVFIGLNKGEMSQSVVVAWFKAVWPRLLPLTHCFKLDTLLLLKRSNWCAA